MDWYLDKMQADPAYHCGRLFAILGFAQELSLGVVNGSVTRKFFGSVMAAPGVYAGRLIGLFEKAHLPGLSNGWADTLRSEMKLVHRGLGHDYPKRLSLPRQSTFALGYYHELAFLDHHPPSRYYLQTKGGDLVQSVGEQIIADHLFDLNLDYVYEPMLAMPPGLTWKHRYPDFLVHHTVESSQIFIEYLGMMDRTTYASDWEIKKSDYRKIGILPIEELAGRRGRWMSIEPGPDGNDGVDILRQIRSVLVNSDRN